MAVSLIFAVVAAILSIVAGTLALVLAFIYIRGKLMPATLTDLENALATLKTDTDALTAAIANKVPGDLQPQVDAVNAAASAVQAATVAIPGLP